MTVVTLALCKDAPRMEGDAKRATLASEVFGGRSAVDNCKVLQVTHHELKSEPRPLTELGKMAENGDLSVDMFLALDALSFVAAVTAPQKRHQRNVEYCYTYSECVSSLTLASCT